MPTVAYAVVNCWILLFLLVYFALFQFGIAHSADMQRPSLAAMQAMQLRIVVCKLFNSFSCVLPTPSILTMQVWMRPLAVLLYLARCAGDIFQ